MTTFIDSIMQVCNMSSTQNDAVSYASTNDSLLDFFSKVGGMRGRDDTAYDMFVNAFAENPVYAVRCLFHMRDVREGMGERDLFRHIIKNLVTSEDVNHTNIAKFAMDYISEYGRWDDFYAYFDSSLKNNAIVILKNQFDQDLANLESKTGHISLLGKWLKSENTSSYASVKLARMTRKGFKLSSQEYRKKLSKLREHIKVVERDMVANKWEEINYEGVPSNAMKNYSKAFKKHDEERFQQYLSDVKSGDKKINSAVLYPYDLYNQISHISANDVAERARIDLQWKNLPNYFTEKTYEILPIIDVSGSMTRGNHATTPISIAISLGLYIAERNCGAFKNHYMTFNEKAKIHQIIGADFYEKANMIRITDSQYFSTNLSDVFKTLLTAIKRNNIPENEVPKQLIIISDMQFNCVGNYSTNFEHIDKMYRDAGITRPNLTFWNVNAYQDSPATKDANNTFLISGSSPSVLKHALNTTIVSPIDLMFDVLNSPRYANINYQ